MQLVVSQNGGKGRTSGRWPTKRTKRTKRNERNERTRCSPLARVLSVLSPWVSIFLYWLTRQGTYTWEPCSFFNAAIFFCFSGTCAASVSCSVVTDRRVIIIIADVVVVVAVDTRPFFIYVFKHISFHFISFHSFIHHGIIIVPWQNQSQKGEREERKKKKRRKKKQTKMENVRFEMVFCLPVVSPDPVHRVYGWMLWMDVMDGWMHVCVALGQPCTIFRRSYHLPIRVSNRILNTDGMTTHTLLRVIIDERMRWANIVVIVVIIVIVVEGVI